MVSASPLDTIICLTGSDANTTSIGKGVTSGTSSTSSSAKASAPEQPVKRPRWWGELLVIAFLAWAYDSVANLAPLRERLALVHGRGILSFEQSLHIAPEATLNRWLSAHDTFATLLSYYYDNAHFVVTFGLLGWLWWKRADIYRPLRSSLVAINLIGLIVFWRYPVAPPRMLSGFTDVIASSHTFGSWHTGSLAADANQFGAMPSLHIAWAAWCTLVLWRLSGRVWVRTLALLYPCVTAFAVIATGNHYVLDLMGGLAAFALAVALIRAGSMSVAHVTKLLLSRKTGRLAAASEDAL
jgi:hypothetical protein